MVHHSVSGSEVRMSRICYASVPASSIHRKIKFLSEIEFEEGGEEVAIEFAALDVNFHPLVNLRGGIVMNPIGAFNQNHDGPKWKFIDRPIAATEMQPGAT
tara:strand:+ start:195262 stop:195564 length:303 start_codon:yes stop_codon:yes gene_type:complete